MAQSEFVYLVICAFMTLIVVRLFAPAAASNSILSVSTKSQKSSRAPQAETKVTESIVEADNVTEVDASEDIDFDDVDVDVDVDVDDKDGPGLIQDDIGDNDELLPNLDTQGETC